MDIIHVDDLIRAHLKAIDHLIHGGETLTVNCGYGRGFSVQDVITAMNNLGEGTINPIKADRREGDSAILIADNSACMGKLGWTPQSDDLAVIVGSALAWEKNNSAN